MAAIPVEHRQRYVIGFLFLDNNIILMQEKKKPERWRGKWSAPGGKVEPGETFHEAMVREFEEETSLKIDTWHEVALYENAEVQVMIYNQIGMAHMQGVRWQELEEAVFPVAFQGFPYHMGKFIENTLWWAQMAREALAGNWEPLRIQVG